MWLVDLDEGVFGLHNEVRMQTAERGTEGRLSLGHARAGALLIVSFRAQPHASPSPHLSVSPLASVRRESNLRRAQLISLLIT